MNIYCFGNEFLEQDFLAMQIADELSIDRINFVKCDSPEQLLQDTSEELIILDVVEGIDKPILITDLNQLRNADIFSLHDLDLSFFLKLMKETGHIKEIKIIGIPMNGNKSKIKREIADIIRNI